MSIIDQIRSPVAGLLQKLLADRKLAKNVTYRQWKSQAFDEAQGHAEDTYEDSLVKAVKLKHTRKSVAASTSSAVEVGDVVYVFKAADLPLDVSLKDLLVADLQTQTIKAIDDIFGLAWFVTVEG
jgi:hypothetical protein